MGKRTVDGENDHEGEGADDEDRKMDGPQQKENERSLSEKEFQKNMKINGPSNLKWVVPEK